MQQHNGIQMLRLKDGSGWVPNVEQLLGRREIERIEIPGGSGVPVTSIWLRILLFFPLLLLKGIYHYSFVFRGLKQMEGYWFGAPLLVVGGCGEYPCDGRQGDVSNSIVVILCGELE